MRWVSRLTAGLLLPPAVVLATLGGTLGSLLWTTPGRVVAARVATSWLTNNVAGQIEIGAISGNIVNHIVLRDVTVRDSLGGVLLRTPMLEARYRLLELAAGRIVLNQLFLDRPVVRLVRLRRGRWNYEEVFRAPATADSSKQPPLVEFRRVSIRQGDIRVDAPTKPHAPLRPVSRNGATPNQPQIEQGSDGLVRVYHATAFTLTVPYVRISTPARDPILVRIAALAMQLNDPKLTLTDLQGEILTAHDSLRFTLAHADLPGTRVRGSGAIRWPSDTILYDFAMTADRVDLADLHWISPDFPDWKGRGRVVAKSLSGSRTDFALDSLTLGTGKASASGQAGGHRRH